MDIVWTKCETSAELGSVVNIIKDVAYSYVFCGTEEQLTRFISL